MPPIRANSLDGHGYKDEYLDTIRKTLSQEVLFCNMKTLISIMYLEVMISVIFFKRSNVKLKRFNFNRY